MLKEYNEKIADMIFSDASNLLNESLRNVIYHNNMIYIRPIVEYLQKYKDVILYYQEEFHESRLISIFNYTRYIEIFNDFTRRHMEIVVSNIEILGEIRREFNIPRNFLPDSSLLIDIFQHHSFIQGKLKDHGKEELEQIISLVNENIKHLANEYFQFGISRHLEEILDLEQKITSQAIKFSEKCSTRTLYYIDQNAIASLTKDCKKSRNTKNTIDKFFSVENCEYVYSSILFEDAVRMNFFFIKEYEDKFKSLNLKKILIKNEKKILVGEEEFAVTLRRAFHLKDLNAASEEMYFFGSCMTYFSDKKPFKEKIFPTPHPLEDFNAEDVQEIDILISYISYKFNNNHITLERIIKKNIPHNNDHELFNNIKILWQLMDAVHFCTPKQKDTKKIRSSLRDCEHLAYAWKADYFITNDKDLIKRGRIIYDILNIKTKFLTIEELHSTACEKLKEVNRS